MNSMARRFFGAALLFGILGFVFGLSMAISHDHSQLPTHAHIMVIGWVSFALFGFFYQLFGSKVSAGLAQVHFWLALVSLIGIVIGLWLIYSGNTEYEPIAAISSIGYAVSFLIFAAVAWPVLRSS
jgi:cbb3-type cytochrome oxidase subunit 1